MNKTTTYSIEVAPGDLTVAELQEFIKDLPPQTVVRIDVIRGDRPFDPDTISVKAVVQH